MFSIMDLSQFKLKHKQGDYRCILKILGILVLLGTVWAYPHPHQHNLPHTVYTRLCCTEDCWSALAGGVTSQESLPKDTITSILDIRGSQSLHQKIMQHNSFKSKSVWQLSHPQKIVGIFNMSKLRFWSKYYIKEKPALYLDALYLVCRQRASVSITTVY